MGEIEDADDAVGEFDGNGRKFGAVLVRRVDADSQSFQCLRQLGVHQCDASSVLSLSFPPTMLNGIVVDFELEFVHSDDEVFRVLFLIDFDVVPTHVFFSLVMVLL